MDTILQILSDNSGTIITGIIGLIISFSSAWFIKGKVAIKELRDIIDAIVVMLEDDKVTKEEIAVLLKEIGDLVSVFSVKKVVNDVTEK